MELLILSLATFFNLIVLHIKYKRKRFADMFIDLSVFITLGFILGDTVTGFSVATVVSALVSVYLLFQPLGQSNANS